MTREEAIIILDCERPYGNCGCGASIEEIEDALNMAIKALEQETVSKEDYDHEYFLRKEFELKIDSLERQLEEQAVKAESILDKIRAEIERMIPTYHNPVWSITDLVPISEVLKLIDKYKAESENT